jgi:hypothetical protein
MPVLLKLLTGRRYYITTLADWHHHAHRFANSHWLALSHDASAIASRELADASSAMPDVGADALAHNAQPSATTRIIVLIDADEGVHLALDDDDAFEALPHPFAPKQSRTPRTRRSQPTASHQARPPSTPPRPSPARTRSYAPGCFKWRRHSCLCAFAKPQSSDLGFRAKSHSVNAARTG